MKLILANNHTAKFVDFYKELQAQSRVPFDYSGYVDLLFVFDADSDKAVNVFNLATNRPLSDYDGIYINGYLSTYELAATVAICAEALGVSFVNHELSNPPSLSKLSMYAKLVAGGACLPRTLAGTKKALARAGEHAEGLVFPAILKRADADRGIDNFKVQDFAEAVELLASHEDSSLWILQEFIENDGFYLVSFYDSQPVFSIYRSLEQRPDGNEQKAHMFKPKGGANARLLEVDQVDDSIVSECQKAIDIMDRQIGSVDCLYNPATGKVYILEVNYNPQLVTIETFKEARVKAFLENLNKI